MEIPENMINHIKEVAHKIEHGEILIKLNKTRNIIDVSFTTVKRFYKEGEKKPNTIQGGLRNG